MHPIKTDLSALNASQHEAVICEDKRILVLAGAGSGKTKTLLQKLVYLVEEKGVSPSNILAITFTRNAANEMIDRLILSNPGEKGYEALLSNRMTKERDLTAARHAMQKKYKWIDALTVKTFHGFCYSILRNYGVNEFDNKFKMISDEKARDDEFIGITAPETAFEVFHKLLIQLCDDTDYLLKLKRYVLDYLVDKIHHKKDEQKFRSNDGKYFTALNGTRVRSKSEQFIADWLYRHNIQFEYEPKVNVKDFDFHPDFYIPAADIYIEHVSNLSFSTKDKVEQFQKGNLTIVKTYESMTKDSSVFNQALDKIFKNRLSKGYKKAALHYKEEFNGFQDKVKDFITMVMRITDMIKVENKSIDDIAKTGTADQHERVRSFYEVALPLVKEYIHYCVDKSYLDYNDLISRCISLFQNNTDIASIYREKFKYVLVDEFQDVNNLQVDLIKLLLTGEAQLFCVGDDWQSIYGFRGSNVSYIVEFEKHFPNSTVIKLNLNYRSTQHIVGASNEVIKYNKFKVEKDVHASKKSEHKIVVYAGISEDDCVSFCSEKVKEHLEEGLKNEDILFLYRRSRMYYAFREQFKEEGIRVQSKTIHAAKGLEAKVVFIIGLKDGSGGFPDIWLEDRIFQVIKKAHHDLLMEEERRLFYVALTRAKDKLYLITEKGVESSFIKEIPEIYTVKTSASLRPVVEKQILCSKCLSQLEKLWIACPYCGEKVKTIN